MSFKNFPGNWELKELFKKLIYQNTISQAILLSGDSLSFKDSFAFEIAKALHCEKGKGDSCGECRNCKLMDGIKDEEGNIVPSHPDFLKIVPEKDIIKINIVRDISKFIRSRPMISRKKVVLIENIDRMNIEAQNAFLKILEEPHFYVHYILTTSRIDTILDTIISRVQKFYLKRVSKAEFFDFFKEFSEDILNHAFEKGAFPENVSEDELAEEKVLSSIIIKIFENGDKRALIELRDLFTSLSKDSKGDFLRNVIFTAKDKINDRISDPSLGNINLDGKFFEYYNKLESLETDTLLNINSDLLFTTLSDLLLKFHQLL